MTREEQAAEVFNALHEFTIGDVVSYTEYLSNKRRTATVELVTLLPAGSKTRGVMLTLHPDGQPPSAPTTWEWSDNQTTRWGWEVTLV